MDPALTLDAAERLRDFDGPVRCFWGTRDPFFPLSLAYRLTATLKDARVTEIANARTYAMLDEPERIADAMCGELSATRPGPWQTSATS